MTLDGKELLSGKLYLWKVATQQGTGIDLHSIYFVTDDNRFFEVVFTKPGEGSQANGWYLVEKQVKPEPEPVAAKGSFHDYDKKGAPIEAEIVEEAEGGTLQIQVEDEMNLSDILGGSSAEEKPTSTS